MHIFCQARWIVYVSDLEINATISLAAGRQVLGKLPVKEMTLVLQDGGSECGADHPIPRRKHLLAESTNYVSWKDTVEADKA
jgi:hypothetical protein